MAKFGQDPDLWIGHRRGMRWVHLCQKVQMLIMPIFRNILGVVLSYHITHIGCFVGKLICEKDKLISVHQILKQVLMKDFGINPLVTIMQHTHLTMYTNPNRVMSWNTMIHRAQNEYTNFIDQEHTMRSTITGQEQIM